MSACTPLKAEPEIEACVQVVKNVTRVQEQRMGTEGEPVEVSVVEVATTYTQFGATS